jgi:hypothetical protein
MRTDAVSHTNTNRVNTPSALGILFLRFAYTAIIAFLSLNMQFPHPIRHVPLTATVGHVTI